MNQYKIKNYRSHNRGIALLSLLLICSVLLLGLAYLFQTNDLVSYSYQIREGKEKLRELQNNNQRLETQVANLQSPISLEEKIKELGMVEAGQMIYLEIGKIMATNK